MRKIFTALLAVCAFGSFSAAQADGLESVCSSSLPVSGFLIKAEASNHINRGDPRTSGYSIICGKECVEFIAQFYYCDGTPAASFGYYGRWDRRRGGNGMPRGYGASGGAPKHSVRQIRSIARRKSCGPMLYIQMTKPDSEGTTVPECRFWDSRSSRSGTPY